MNKWRLLLFSVLSLLQSASTERDFVHGRDRYRSVNGISIRDSIYESLRIKQDRNFPDVHDRIRDVELVRSPPTRYQYRERHRKFSPIRNDLALTNHPQAIDIERFRVNSQHERINANEVRLHARSQISLDDVDRNYRTDSNRRFTSRETYKAENRARFQSRNTEKRQRDKYVPNRRERNHHDGNSSPKTSQRSKFEARVNNVRDVSYVTVSRNMADKDFVRDALTMPRIPRNVEKANDYNELRKVSRDDTFSTLSYKNSQGNTLKVRSGIELQGNDMSNDNIKNYNVRQKRNTDTRVLSEINFHREHNDVKYSRLRAKHLYGASRNNNRSERLTDNQRNRFQIQRDVSRRNIATFSNSNNQRYHVTSIDSLSTERFAQMRNPQGTHNTIRQESSENIEQNTIRKEHLTRLGNTRFERNENYIRKCNTRILPRRITDEIENIRDQTVTITRCKFTRGLYTRRELTLTPKRHYSQNEKENRRNRLQSLATEERVIDVHQRTRIIQNARLGSMPRIILVPEVNNKNNNRQKGLRGQSVENRSTNNHNIFLSRQDSERGQLGILQHYVKGNIRSKSADNFRNKNFENRPFNILNNQRQYADRSMKNFKDQDSTNNMFTNNRQSYEQEDTRSSRRERQTSRQDRNRISIGETRNKMKNSRNNRENQLLNLRYRVLLQTDQNDLVSILHLNKRSTRNNEDTRQAGFRSVSTQERLVNEVHRTRNSQESNLIRLQTTERSNKHLRQHRSHNLSARESVTFVMSRIREEEITNLRQKIPIISNKRSTNYIDEIGRDRSRRMLMADINIESNEIQNDLKRFVETRSTPLIGERQTSRQEARYDIQRITDSKAVRRMTSRSLSKKNTLQRDTRITSEGRLINRRSVSLSDERQYSILRGATAMPTDNARDIHQDRLRNIRYTQNIKDIREKNWSTRQVIFKADARNLKVTENRQQTKYQSTEERVANRLQKTDIIKDNKIHDTRRGTLNSDRRLMEDYEEIHHDRYQSLSSEKRVTGGLWINRNNMQRVKEKQRATFHLSLTSGTSLNNSNTESTFALKWQYLFYLLQGIYICYVMMIMPKEHNGIKNTRIAAWFTNMNYLKLD